MGYTEEEKIELILEEIRRVADEGVFYQVGHIYKALADLQEFVRRLRNA
jgi:hypothetical protein